MEYAANVEKAEYKYNAWCCTINSLDDGRIINSVKLSSFLSDNCEEWVCQQEEGARLHWQCVFRTNTRLRKATLLKKFEKYLDDIPIHTCTLMRCMDWEKAKKYCSDVDKRMNDMILMYPELYSESDISFLDDENNRYPWQNKVLDLLLTDDRTKFRKPDDRTIHWIYDEWGNSGKSKFVKWLFCRYPGVTKLAFGTSTQLRAAICAEGAKKIYFIDFPRTLGSEDSLNTTLSVVEDLKNGFVRSNMYGSSSTLLMEPPHIVCFSNNETPIHKMSSDRWKSYSLEYKILLENDT